MKKCIPELVSPAGDWPSLRVAVESGADSVYFGVKGLNMRHQASNFDIKELKKVLVFLHEHKRRGYLALNVIVMNKELKKVKMVLNEAKEAGVDAVILWDMAVFSLAKKLGLRIHLSTQASVSSLEALKFYSRLGVQRVILARECTLADIKEIRVHLRKDQIPCEIETFIHGAMCVSISGRCFLSAYSFGRSANKGECFQPCRREYIIQSKDKDIEYVLGKDYILSPKDLCTIEFIDQCLNVGVQAFKIEGRMRSPEYTKVVTHVYRQAIDAFQAGTLTTTFKRRLKEQLKTVYNRGFSSGFYFGLPQEDVSRGLEHTYEKVLVGEVKRFFKRIGVAEIHLHSRGLKKRDQLLFIGKSTAVRMAQVEEMQENHKTVLAVAKGSRVGVKLPFVVRPKDKVFLRREKI